MTECIVCHSNLVESFSTLDKNKYWKCNFCQAKFLDKHYFIDEVSEKDRYLEHENVIEDPRYRNFLSRLSVPLVERLNANSKGLDFGCGPGPALADILVKDGYEVDLYDPFFFPNQNIFSNQYDFITCTETVEHFHNPFEEFKKLDDLLIKGGWLGIMTNFLTEEEAFEKWYYRRDPTHVTFYSEETFKVIGKQRNWDLEIISKNIVIFKK